MLLLTSVTSFLLDPLTIIWLNITCKSFLRKFQVSKSIASDGFMAPDERLQNAQLAINLSRKIGAKIYASPMDLVEGKQKMILTIFVGLMSRSFEIAEKGKIVTV